MNEKSDLFIKKITKTKNDGSIKKGTWEKGKRINWI